MLSMLVISRSSDSVYQELLQFLDETFDGNLSDANPVNTAQLKMKTLYNIIQNHIYTSPSFSLQLIKDIWYSTIIKLSKWISIPDLGTHANGRLSTYIPTMRTHADYRKFDDVLRMVLDCSEKQIKEIEQYLETQYKEGHLFYGLYTSETALMTCYVQDIEPGQHIHFIDGGDGGYAMAAKQLKAQQKEHTS